MELGGNAPFLVFEDADLDAAIDGAMLAKMRNIGEACTAANRFHVAESVADEFTEKLAAKLAVMPVGRGTEDGVQVGPLVDETSRDKVAELVQRAHAEEAGVPELARGMLSQLSGQLDTLDLKLKALESRLLALHKENPVSRCLATQPGIGPVGAISFTLKVSDPQGFHSGRHFAAWLGLTPRENSTGGRHRPGRISRQGDAALRKLLVLGATAVIRFARAGKTSPWLMNLLARRPKKLAAVALANKMARTLWAMMVSGEIYRRPQQA